MNEKAIALTSDVEKQTYNGKQTWLISPDMFKKINEKIPGKSGNCRTLLYYLIFQKQNSDDFHPAEATIRDYCGLSSHDAYVTARKWLNDNGYITYIPYKEICINYQNIMK